MAIIDGAKVGDSSDWIPISMQTVGGEDYYLIVRMNCLTLTGTGTKSGVGVAADGKRIRYGGTPGWNNYANSDLENVMKAWWGATNNSGYTITTVSPGPSAVIRTLAVASDADTVLGTCRTPQSINDGFSAPATGSYVFPFAMSNSEASTFISIQWHNGTNNQTAVPPRSTYATSNWQAMRTNTGNPSTSGVPGYGDANSVAWWLRSGGTYSGSPCSGVVNGSGELGGFFPTYSPARVRPALWVKADIMDYLR